MSQSLLESSNAAQLIGLKVERDEDTEVVVLDTTEQHAGANGMVNPYLVFPIMLAAAGHMAAGDQDSTMIGSFTFTPFQAVPVGARLVASARCTAEEKGVLMLECNIRHEGVLVAYSTYMRQVIPEAQ